YGYYDHAWSPYPRSKYESRREVSRVLPHVNSYGGNGQSHGYNRDAQAAAGIHAGVPTDRRQAPVTYGDIGDEHVNRRGAGISNRAGGSSTDRRGALPAASGNRGETRIA